MQFFSRPRAIFLCMAQSPRWRRAMHNIIRARWQTLGIQLTSHLIGDGITDQNVVAFHFFSSLFLTYARFSLFVPFWLLFGFLPFFAMAPFQHNQFDKTLVYQLYPNNLDPQYRTKEPQVPTKGDQNQTRNFSRLWNNTYSTIELNPTEVNPPQ